MACASQQNSLIPSGTAVRVEAHPRYTARANGRFVRAVVRNKYQAPDTILWWSDWLKCLVVTLQIKRAIVAMTFANKFPITGHKIRKSQLLGS
jgi:hypothetical protein